MADGDNGDGNGDDDVVLAFGATPICAGDAGLVGVAVEFSANRVGHEAASGERTLPNPKADGVYGAVLTPDEARMFAYCILDAVAHAETDGLIMWYLTQEIGLPVVDAEVTLEKLGEQRAKMRGEYDWKPQLRRKPN